MKRAKRLKTKPRKKSRTKLHNQRSRGRSVTKGKRRTKKRASVIRARIEYDFCLAKDRERFYKKLREDYKKQIAKREPEDIADIRFHIDIGEHTRKKRKATAYIGTRRFQSIRRLRKFLLLTRGYSNETINWSRKTGMCQFPKYARMVIAPIHPRGRIRILHSYRLKQPL